MSTWTEFRAWMAYVDRMRDEVGCAKPFDVWRKG